MIESIANKIERLEYPISYQGDNYIATQALFREGDNPLAILCYEQNIWDQVEQKSYTWPQFVAIAKSISLEDAVLWLEGVDMDDGNVDHIPKKEKVPQENFLREDDYEDLVKSYKFFLDRGISAETLDYFGAGLAQGGPMYGRVVFKIRDERGALVGATGRDVLKRDIAKKWKIKGKKNKFVYPAFDKNLEAIKKTGQVVILESVGDALSLCNSGVWQVNCCFGLNMSPEKLAFLLKINPDQIFLSLNNDLDKEKNRGQNAAEKIKEKLLRFFEPSKIIEAPPIKGDFGEQSTKENLEWAKKYKVEP